MATNSCHALLLFSYVERFIVCDDVQLALSEDLWYDEMFGSSRNLDGDLTNVLHIFGTFECQRTTASL